MAEVRLEKVRKSFGAVDVIHDVDLDIQHREFVVFVGPSGCGKSTLLRLVAGLEDLTGGNLFIAGENVNDRTPSERKIAMVFQSYALYPHMSVYENMAFGLKLAKQDKAEAERRVREAAAILQLEPLLDRKPRQLSGGQRQRVAIGRAIVREPNVFLFDEPLSNLDAALRVQMRVEIARLHNRLDTTMIYVTHDQTEAMTLADKIVVLNRGRVEQVGAPLELYHNPANRFVAGFIGSPTMNFLPAAVRRGEGEWIELELPHGTPLRLQRSNRMPADRDVILGIRPEHLTLDNGADAAISGSAIAVEHLGAETYLHIDVGTEQTLVAKVPGDSSVRSGENVRIGIPADATYLFDRDGRAVGAMRSA